MKHLLRVFAVLAVSGTALVALSAPSAAAIDFTNDACRNPGTGNSAACDRGSRYPLLGNDGIIARATNLVAIVSGVAAVIVIIVAGLNFVTAGGDSNKVSTARKTIIFAVAGLVLIALARTIIVFVVSRL